MVKLSRTRSAAELRVRSFQHSLPGEIGGDLSCRRPLSCALSPAFSSDPRPLRDRGRKRASTYAGRDSQVGHTGASNQQYNLSSLCRENNHYSNWSIYKPVRL